MGESSEPLSIWLAVLQTSVRPRSDATCSLLRVRSFLRPSCGAEARPEFMVAATERRRNNERTERSGNLRHSATLTHSVFSGSNKPFYCRVGSTRYICRCRTDPALCGYFWRGPSVLFRGNFFCGQSSCGSLGLCGIHKALDLTGNKVSCSLYLPVLPPTTKKFPR